MLRRKLLNVLIRKYVLGNVGPMELAISDAIKSSEITSHKMLKRLSRGEGELGLYIELWWPRSSGGVNSCKIMNTPSGIMIDVTGEGNALPKLITDLLVDIPPELESMFQDVDEDETRELTVFDLLQMCASLSAGDYKIVCGKISDALEMERHDDARFERFTLGHSTADNNDRNLKLTLQTLGSFGLLTTTIHMSKEADGELVIKQTADGASQPVEFSITHSILALKIKIPPGVRFF